MKKKDIFGNDFVVIKGRLQYYLRTIRMIINKPITLYFEPIALEVKFQKCLKLQIAIFRLGSQQGKGQKRAVKMDKTDPVKFTNPQQKVTFSKTLSLLTTLPFNSQTQIYQSKQVDFQVALQVDGKKERMGRKINIREILLAKTKTYKFVQENPFISFTYRAQVKIQDQKSTEQPKRLEEPKKNTKFIRFQENAPTNTKENFKITKQQSQNKLQRIQKGRHKTVFFEPSQQGKIVDSNSEQTKMKKYKSLHKENISEASQKQSQKKGTSQSDFNLKLKMEEFKDKCQKLQEKLNEQQRYNQQLQKKIKEKDAKMIQLMNKNQEIQQKLQNELKSHKKEKEDLRKQLVKTNQQNQIITQLKQEIRSYQQQIQKLRKTAHNYQQSTKHIANGSQQQTRNLKERISNLQRQNIEISKQSDLYQQSLKNKDQIISDLKAKIYAIDKENLQMQNKIKSIENKLNKSKEEYQSEIQELQNKIDQMKEDNKNFKIATLKDIKDDNTVDYKKKVQVLQKQLQKKQELLRKMTEMKKQNENERNYQINNLKKELASINEINQKLESSKNTNSKQCGDIQIKIQLQKIKKELDTARKNEKALLIQKGKLQANNRCLQDDIVKNKCAIANILNAVQQTGNQKLITQVYTLTE